MNESSTGWRDDDDVEEQILTVAPRIAGMTAAGPLARMKSWMMRTRAQEANAKSASFLNEVVERPDSSFSAAICDIWDALALGAAEGRSHRAWTILVTSLSAGVGKTTIAANLARFAAAEGAKTLLIEANPTNPQLRRMIEPDAKPGLIDVIALERLIYEIACEGVGSLHVVPMTPSEHRIVRRLTGRPGVPYFDGIARRFDFVAIDGPSAEDADDLRALIAAADRIALVVTPEEQVEIQSFMEEFGVPRRKLGGSVVSMIQQRRKAA